MKRTTALIVVFILALAVVPMALAANGKGKGHGRGHGANHGKAKGKNKFQLNGVVVSPGTTAGSIVVTVKSGSKTVKSFRGRPLTLLVAPAARFVDATADDESAATDSSPAPLTPTDLVAGARVHLGGTIDRTDPANPVFTATKVILQALPATAPTPEPSSTDVTPTPEPSPGDTAQAMLIR